MRLTRWLTRLLVESDDEDRDRRHQDLADAQAASQDAREKLEQTELGAREVRAIADNARRLRQQNHFSVRIADAFGRISRNGNG